MMKFILDESLVALGIKNVVIGIAKNCRSTCAFIRFIFGKAKRNGKVGLEMQCG